MLRAAHLRCVLVAPLLCGCAGNALERRHAELHDGLPQLRAKAEKLRQGVQEEDARIGLSLQERELSPGQRSQVESFLSARKELLRRYEESVQDLVILDEQVHIALGLGGTPEDETAFERKVEAWRARNGAVLAEFDSIVRNKREIEEMLQRAPRK